MSKFWKWFLGIVLGLALFASGVFVGSMMQAHMAFAGDSRMVIVGDRPMGHAGEDEDGSVQIGPAGEMPEGGVVQFGVVESYGPRGHGHGFKGRDDFEHGGLLFLVGGLLHLALFLGLIYGAYRLGRRNARIVLDPEPGLPTKSVVAFDAAPAKPAPKRSGKKIA